jgi:preprotein translocase subunit YajC
VETYALIAEEAAPPAAPGADGAQKPQSDWSMFILLGLLFVVFYVLLIRPQQKKEREKQKHREEMLKNLTKSDHVMTIGGMHGVVASVTDTDVVLKVDEKNDIRIRFGREAISKVVTDEPQAGEKKFSEKPEENK